VVAALARAAVTLTTYGQPDARVPPSHPPPALLNSARWAWPDPSVASRRPATPRMPFILFFFLFSFLFFSFLFYCLSTAEVMRLPSFSHFLFVFHFSFSCF
jgi:hypothetical protein